MDRRQTVTVTPVRTMPKDVIATGYVSCERLPDGTARWRMTLKNIAGHKVEVVGRPGQSLEEVGRALRLADDTARMMTNTLLSVA